MAIHNSAIVQVVLQLTASFWHCHIKGFGISWKIVYTCYNGPQYAGQFGIIDNFKPFGLITYFHLASNSGFNELCHNRHQVTTNQILVFYLDFGH